jgi:hypothetical protein
VRRLSVAIVAALFAVGVLAPATFAASPGASGGKAVPKVVLVVGPAGAATDGYRAQARAAAAVARQYTPDVVEIYSPNATWPAVKAALDGASLVVYMGHGNGWPSRYRDDLFPPTQNGFGLNPSAGSGDTTHQYFGEAFVGSQVKLAKNAVVLLNHLCYASGLTEPGLSVGTLDQARQRVDNYAAGFIRAGAAAVVAEAYDSPSYMVRAILAGGRSIQGAWTNAPSANGHRIAFESSRSPGYVAQMDTETASSGYSRSIVMRTGLASADVLSGAAGSVHRSPGSPTIALQPSLASTGIRLGTPAFRDLPAAGTGARLDVPFKIKDRTALPNGVQASVRWDPIDVQVVPVEPATEVTPEPVPPEAPAASADPDASVVPDGARTGAHRPTRVPTTVDAGPDAPVTVPDPPAVTPRLDAPPDDLGLVVPEQVGDVVAPAPIKFTKKQVVVPVVLPTTPGRYRLTISLHDGDGVAYDATTQAMLPSLIVRVTGDFDGSISAVQTARLTAGSVAELGVRVANLGQTAWGAAAIPPASNLSGFVPAKVASIVGRWVPLTTGAELPADPSQQTVSADLPIGLAPGATAEATLEVTAPTAPGDYLLVLDVVTPDEGSLIATGVSPTLVRVTVTAAAAE